MSSKTGLVIVSALALLVTLFFWSRPTHRDSLRSLQDEGRVETPAEESAPTDEVRAGTPTPKAKSAGMSPGDAMDANRAEPLQAKPAAPDETLELAVRDYKVEDGVAVIENDIVIGLPGQAGREAQVPKITPWPTRVIPVYIQPSVPNPQRIAEAISYFDRTAVQFVPFANQKDVLVFENGTEHCKSYVGKIGGKQPIYLNPRCTPSDIAHELMHALGFIHEQNRADRDSSTRLNRENVDPTALVNFEKLPSTYMRLSGLAGFDFESLMLYPPTMFSRNGDPTISSATGQPIAPSERLSPLDVARINSYYGSR